MSLAPLPSILALIANLMLATAAPTGPPAPPAAAGPVSVMVTAATDDSGARLTFTFSRRVDYRLEESRARLRLILPDQVSDSSMVDRDLDSDQVRRIRFDQTSRGTEVVFYLGRGFGTFSSAEADDPFRITFQFQKEGPPGAPAPPDKETRGAEIPAGPPGPSGSEPGSDRPRTRIVVIDPGHGGAEEGAVSGSGLKEKDLVLDIARRLRTRLQDAGFSVPLTRDEDQSLGLIDRTALANHAGAGIFLSIHANSSMRPAARGAETYFLSTGATADEQAMSVARQENLASLGPSDGADDATRSEVRAVLWDLAQSEHLSASSRLAEMIQAEMNGLTGAGDRKDRGIKQAPFRVLVGASMPAALVEVGFLTNDDEEKKLATQEYRDQIAQALAAAVQRFTQDREREEGGAR